MNDSTGGTISSILMIILDIVAVIGGGILAWNWIVPDSFLSAVLFIAVWGILGKVIQFVGAVVILCIAKLLE